jgi:hypothetical protein
MANDFKLSEFTKVAPRYQRSINLQQDWKSGGNSSGYIVTPNVAQSLERLFHGITEGDGLRAFSLTGPYGTGKSAFALFLCQLLSSDSSQAEQAIKLLPKESASLKRQLNRICSSNKTRSGFLPIPVTARRRPIAQLILEGLISALTQLRSTKAVKDLQTRMESAKADEAWQDTAIILDFLSALSKEAESQGFCGILLLVDEAGKTLEYALQDRGGGDVYIFQELAEYANRMRTFPVLFLITLHQMFDDYVELSDRTLKNEWNKVQERFQTIQFHESAATTIKMVCSALQPSGKLPIETAKSIDEALRKIRKNGIPLPLGLEHDEFCELAKNAWPLHPSVLLAMPHLFRRLAQNERSIFSYLTSLESFGFQEHLSQTLTREDSFIRLHHLYTYLLANFEAGLARLPHAKRLLEANDIIKSRQHLTKVQLELVQSVALLNVLSEICPLRATLHALSCSMENIANVEGELEQLKKQSILTYRRLDGSFRVWEGSDVDIEARMTEGRRKLQLEGSSPMETLCRHLPERTLVARKHSLETGVHRYFNLIYTEVLSENVLKKAEDPTDAAGTVVVLLPLANPKKLEAEAGEKTKGRKRIIVALPRQIDALRTVVEEVACLRWVVEHTPELRDDRIAQREVSLQLSMGEQLIAQLLQTLLDPRPAPTGNTCRWIWDGVDQALQWPVEVTRLLSDVCDNVYPKSPRIRNELVVRNKLSSAAASARRCLLERMLENRPEECLGIKDYPPERSVYESVLHATGIHYFDESLNEWSFRAPPANNAMKLRPCWDLMEREVFSDEIRRIELVDLFAKWVEVPYGMPDGLHPILFTAFYLLYQDELFLYRENTFVPDVQTAHLELMQRRPDLFSVSGARLEGTRKAVVERLARGLKKPAKTASVVRALYQILNTLPQVTLKTSRINNAAVMEMRDALQDAAAPEALLFIELPRCFGMDPFMGGEVKKTEIDRFFEHLNNGLSTLSSHAQNLLTKHRNQLLRACDLSPNAEGWHELERRCTWLAPRIKHEVLTPFINCINNGIADGHNARPALSLIANRPFEQWTDMDIDGFNGLVRGMGEIFLQSWRNYGDGGPELTAEELKQKTKLRKTLEPQLKKIGESPRVLAAALRELLNEIVID